IEDVLKFNKTFLKPVLTTPQMPAVKRCVSMQISIQKQIDDLNSAWSDKNIDKAAYSISDCLYTLTSMACELGLQNCLERYLREVHTANMTKIETVNIYYLKDKRENADMSKATTEEEIIMINTPKQIALV